MAYLVILNNDGDNGSKVMAVAPFEGDAQAREILADWAEMAIWQVENLDPPFSTYDFEMMVEFLTQFDVSVEVVDGI